MPRKHRDPLPPYVPGKIRTLVDWLEEATGTLPTVERLDDSRWQLTIANERVRSTVDFKKTPGGKVKWDSSRLWVDGEERPIVNAQDDFPELFLYPDGPEPVPEGQAEPMPPEAAPADAPAKVREDYNRIRKGLSGKVEAHIRLGRKGPRWVIGVTNERFDFRFRYVLRNNSEWVADPRMPVQAVIEGVDRTDEIKGDITKAFRMMQGVPTNNAPPPSGIAGGPKGAAGRANSVQVRNTTVIRN